MIDIVERLRICAKFDPDQAEAADEIERLRDTRIEFIDMINKLVDERVSLRKDIQRLRKALTPFAYYADQIPDDVSNTESASGTVGDLRAAKAALE